MAKKRRRKPTPIPQESGLELAFLRIWNHTAPKHLPAPVREYKFDPNRSWRLDFAWPDIKVSVEIQGGQWKKGGGGHQRGGGFRKNCEKINAAQLAGWTVLQYTTDHMEKMPIQVVVEVVEIVTKELGAGK